MDYAYRNDQTLIGGFLTEKEARLNAPSGSRIHFSQDCISSTAQPPSTERPEGTGDWEILPSGKVGWHPYEESDLTCARQKIDTMAISKASAATLQLINIHSIHHPSSPRAKAHAQGAKEVLESLGLGELQHGLQRRLHHLENVTLHAQQAMNRMSLADQQHIQTHIEQIMAGTSSWHERWLTTPPPECLTRVTIETRINLAERSLLHAMATFRRLQKKAHEQHPRMLVQRTGEHGTCAIA